MPISHFAQERFVGKKSEEGMLWKHFVGQIVTVLVTSQTQNVANLSFVPNLNINCS